MDTKILKDEIQRIKEDFYEYYIGKDETEPFDSEKLERFLDNELNHSEFSRREDQTYMLGEIDILEYIIYKLGKGK